MKKLIVLVAVALATSVVPALAKNPNPTKPKHPAQSHKCQPHKAAYTISGTLVSGSLTGTKHHYSGSLTVHVLKANKHARGDKGKDVPYTITNANIQLGKGETASALTPNSRVKLNGFVLTFAKKCGQPAGSPTIRNGSIKLPKTH